MPGYEHYQKSDKFRDVTTAISKTDDFLEFEMVIAEAQEIIEAALQEVERRWPAGDGWCWGLNADGTLGKIRLMDLEDA